MKKTSDVGKFFLQNLWASANLITGFAVVQTIGFAYACTKKDFIEMIDTFWVKAIIATHLFIVTTALCYAVWWCADKCVALLRTQSIIESDVSADFDLVEKIIRRSTWGRIALIIWLLIPMLFSLYAKQLSKLMLY